MFHPIVTERRWSGEPIRIVKLKGSHLKACFEAHIARPHVKHAEDRLKREEMFIELAKEWHFYRL